MKKILTVSLGALLVATAANADIASVSYVTDAISGKQDASTIGTVTAANMGTTATTVVGAISEVAGEAAAAQSTANTAATNAAAAQSTANTAVTNAATAQTAANTANTAIAAMDLAATGGEGKVIRSVTQTDGKVTAKAEAVDPTPTVSSTKLVTSGGVYTALSGKQDASTIGTVTAAAMGTTATTVVTAIKEVAGKATAAQTAANTANTAIAGMDLAATGGEGKVIRGVAQTDGKVTATAEAVDTEPTDSSAKLITSGGVYGALAKKIDLAQGTQNAGKGLVVDRTTGNLTLTDIATQTELNTVSTNAATNALAALDYDSITDTAVGGDLVGEGGKYIVSVKQENGAVSILTKDYVDVISDGVEVAPTSNAVYDALTGKVNKALGSGAASKAVVTDASGNITPGTIATSMIADTAVTTAKIANGAITTGKIYDGTITNADISATAEIAQSKISGLSTSLAGKQALLTDGVEGKFYVADSGSGWKDMFEAMPKNEACEQEGTKCSLTHKSGKYYWEIVRE